MLNGDRHNRVRREARELFKSGKPFKNPYLYLGNNTEGATLAAVFDGEYEKVKKESEKK